ncbi:MAG: hypothetical protein Q9207_005255 [Kuettlingeria erythrocarpa]
MLSLFSKIATRLTAGSRSVQPSTVRPISITCRGAPITEEELFEYNNGRFLLEEKQQYSRRYMKFNVQKLCEKVSSITEHGAPVCKIDKMEGGFSKALLMTTEDGAEVVAKIPNPTAGRAKYSTASEAAVLQYVREYTTVPVPKILAWNDDALNPVGAEYIIMEKAPGVQLYKVWDEIQDYHRLRLIESLTKMEHQLAAIQFPAYGGLYLRHSISNPSQYVPLDPSMDSTRSYCIGPQCGPSWTDGTSHQDIQKDIDAGPWLDLTQFTQGLALRSLAQSCLPMAKNMAPSLHGTKDEYESVLNSARKVIPYMAEIPALQQTSAPSLWHPDLHMGNIFVSEADHAQITCLIDWQSACVSPLFLQPRWPVFLTPLTPLGFEDIKDGLPKLPKNFDQLDAADKTLAMYEKDNATYAKAYMAATFLKNRKAYMARFSVKESLQGFFSDIGDIRQDGIVPLKVHLVRIFLSWESMGFSDPCPLRFTSAEIDSLNRQSDEYTRFQEIQSIAKKYLSTDSEGWIAPLLDFAEKEAQNRALLELVIEQFKSQMSADEVRAIWPFPP